MFSFSIYIADLQIFLSTIQELTLTILYLHCIIDCLLGRFISRETDIFISFVWVSFFTWKRKELFNSTFCQRFINTSVS